MLLYKPTTLKSLETSFVLFLIILHFGYSKNSSDNSPEKDEYFEDEHGVILPTPCEGFNFTVLLMIYRINHFILNLNIVCKYLAIELAGRIGETTSSETLRLGQGIDESKKRAVRYQFSYTELLCA